MYKGKIENQKLEQQLLTELPLIDTTSSQPFINTLVSCCTNCQGEGEVEKNIWRGEEGMQIEMDVMVICSKCDGSGIESSV